MEVEEEDENKEVEGEEEQILGEGARRSTEEAQGS